MEYRFYIGTKVIFGKNCVFASRQELEKLGKRAFIVCGRNSARASGALKDVAGILEEAGIAYEIYDNVENNPTLENVADAGCLASRFRADCIIGIGGGSPLDAAKAVAVLAVNEIEPVELYSGSFKKKPLPIIAIPTTAGTGSEVTPYSILTRKDLRTKMSFGSEELFPRVAFLDARYTESMSYDTTVDTAVDAFSHAVEGYLSKRSTPVSDVLAVEAVSLFGQCIEPLLEGKIDFSVREKLLHASMLGGMVISHTGTTLVHSLGYSLTYFKSVPHGRANGVFMKEYLLFNYEYAKEKIDNIFKLLGIKDTEEFGDIMDRLAFIKRDYSEDEIKLYASLAIKQKGPSYNIRNVCSEDLFDIMKRSLLSKRL
ncbi:MAG: iron-containing alcohol dehydrogenase family protein [Clostridia bacterium]|nr:iron-containing alcohol dehydrogenase family protein [Clostridia bacterium]